MGRRRPRTGSAALTSATENPARHWAEVVAERHLTGLGWRLLARNYRLRGGELDLVYDDQDGTLVFVEVRQRSSQRFGGAAESIDRRKLARLQRTAAHFLAYGPRSATPDAATPDAATPDAAETRVRFDAVLVTGREGDHVTDHVTDILR